MDDNTRMVLERFPDTVDKLAAGLISKLEYLLGAGVAFSAHDIVLEGVQAIIEVVRSSQ